MNNWKFFIILYLMFSVIFNYSYKSVTKSMNKSSAMTILVQILSSLFCLFFIPFFKIKYPNEIKVYLFLFLAIIFYTLNDRLGTIVRSRIDASIYTIIKQLSLVFMILFGIVFLKERIIINRIVGSALIIFSNVFILYGKEKLNKNIILGIIANVCLAMALIIDVNYSSRFNLAFYVLIVIIVPAMLILVFEKVKLNDIVLEYRKCNKTSLLLTSSSWVIMMITKLKSYSLGTVSVVAPISSLTVILTVLTGYLFFNERNNVIKKIISGILIVIGILLIKL